MILAFNSTCSKKDMTCTCVTRILVWCCHTLHIEEEGWGYARLTWIRKSFSSQVDLEHHQHKSWDKRQVKLLKDIKQTDSLYKQKYDVTQLIIIPIIYVMSYLILIQHILHWLHYCIYMWPLDVMYDYINNWVAIMQIMVFELVKKTMSN